MSVFVECGTAGAPGGIGLGMPVEMGSDLKWSESLASGATSAVAAPIDCIMTLTPTANGYIAFGPGTPSASGNPRRRLLANFPRSFSVQKGDKVTWLEG